MKWYINISRNAFWRVLINCAPDLGTLVAMPRSAFPIQCTHEHHLCRGAARNVEYLKYLGVTHVLNAAEGVGFGQVSTSAEFYRPHGLSYKGLMLEDMASEDMRSQFEPASDFIEAALAQNGTFLAASMNASIHRFSLKL